MYSTNPAIIEADDIEALLSSSVTQMPDGSYMATLQVRLLPTKAFTEAPSLHVTNGIMPRLLSVFPAPVSSEPEPEVDATSEITSTDTTPVADSTPSEPTDPVKE